MTLIYLVLAWIAGLVLARTRGLAGYWLLLPGALGLAMVCLSRRFHHLRLAGALLCTLALGGWRFQLAQPAVGPSQLAYYNGRGQVTVRGFIAADPQVRAARTQLQVQVDHIHGESLDQPVSGQLVITVGAFPRYIYGQRVLITGTLVDPPLYEDFNYREYLAAKGVRSVMRTGQVAVLDGQAGSWYTRSLLQANHYLRDIVERILSQPEAGLLQGVLLGADDALPADAADSFRLAGLTHILVVSGFNISILMQLVLLVAQKALRRQLALGIAMVVITFFGLLVGFSAPVQRAWLMGMLTIAAWLVGRRAHPLTSLAAASLIMTAANPLSLWSVSFQLSFAATVALICAEPIAERLMQRIWPRPHGKVWETAAALIASTVAAQLLTLPLIWHYFGQLSLVALLANLLVLPLQPLILAAGAVVTVVGAFYLQAGRLLAMLLWPLLRYTILIPRWLSNLPFSALELDRISIAGIILLYSAFAAGLYALSKIKARQPTRSQQWDPKPWLLPAALLLVASALWGFALSLPNGGLRIYMLDVGQGDAILIKSPGGRTILVDGGADGLTLRARLGEALALNQHAIDLVVATHGDADHIGGLVDLPAYYQIGQALRPPELGASTAATAWKTEYVKHAVQQRSLSRGAVIRIGDSIELYVLNPPADTDESGNAASLVMNVKQGKFNLLLTGDIDRSTELEMIASDQNIAAYVLKVAHHGSDTSSSDAFLSLVNPAIALISVGADNKLGHPSQQVLDRLATHNCQIWRTDELGTIILSTDGNILQVSALGK